MHGRSDFVVVSIRVGAVKLGYQFLDPRPEIGIWSPAHRRRTCHHEWYCSLWLVAVGGSLVFGQLAAGRVLWRGHQACDLEPVHEAVPLNQNAIEQVARIFAELLYWESSQSSADFCGRFPGQMLGRVHRKRPDLM